MAFKIGDKVKTVVGPNVPALRTNGTVKHLACYLATSSGGKTCDKKTCTHALRDYAWVMWPSGQIFSYAQVELADDMSGTVMPTPGTLRAVQKAQNIPPDDAATAFFKGAMDPWALSTRVGSIPAKAQAGMHCSGKHCNQFVPYAEPNMPGNKFMCYSCRSR